MARASRRRAAPPPLLAALLLLLLATRSATSPAYDPVVSNPFRPSAQLRILGAMQRPWELRPFYASSIGAGSFVPLASPFTGAAMASQHPAAPGGTDGMHPAADDGRQSPFAPVLLAIWDRTKTGGELADAFEKNEKRVPLALLSGGISVYEIGTQCTTLHGPDCPALKRIARGREMAVMLATIVSEPTLQWWNKGTYSLDRGVQVLLSKLPVWRRSYGPELRSSRERPAEVAGKLRNRAGGADASTTTAAVAAQAQEARTKQALERVAAAQAAGAETPEFVSIGRGYCRAPNDGKTHYTYRCFPQCRGKDQLDLKTCESLCTQNCTAISHRQSDGRCVLYYGGLFRAFMNEVGWQHQKGTAGQEDPGQIVAASAYQGVDHACLTRIDMPKISLSASAEQAAKLRQEASKKHEAQARARAAQNEVASSPQQPSSSSSSSSSSDGDGDGKRINQLNAPPKTEAEGEAPPPRGAGGVDKQAAGAEAAKGAK